MSETPWIKASASGDSGNCVEMRRFGEAIQVRDTKARGLGPTLGFTAIEFGAWIEGAKRGEFDHLTLCHEV